MTPVKVVSCKSVMTSCPALEIGSHGVFQLWLRKDYHHYYYYHALLFSACVLPGPSDDDVSAHLVAEHVGLSCRMKRQEDNEHPLSEAPAATAIASHTCLLILHS
jgi:hypothetical protein